MPFHKNKVRNKEMKKKTQKSFYSNDAFIIKRKASIKCLAGIEKSKI
jgi:hypothetical protein